MIIILVTIFVPSKLSYCLTEWHEPIVYLLKVINFSWNGKIGSMVQLFDCTERGKKTQTHEKKISLFDRIKINKSRWIEMSDQCYG